MTAWQTMIFNDQIHVSFTTTSAIHGVTIFRHSEVKHSPVNGHYSYSVLKTPIVQSRNIRVKVETWELNNIL